MDTMITLTRRESLQVFYDLLCAFRERQAGAEDRSRAPGRLRASRRAAQGAQAESTKISPPISRALGLKRLPIFHISLSAIRFGK